MPELNGPESRRPEPPVISAVVLADLTDVTAAEVHDGDQREAERYEAGDFAGADLEFTSFTACAFHRSDLDGARLRGAHFAEVTMTELDVAELTAPRSSWRSVQVSGSRIGAAELYESHWRSVEIIGSKLGYLNARTSVWQDVIFRDCVIDELDLGSATISRLAFEQCEIRTLDLARARCTDLDLRGAQLQTIKGLGGLAGAWISDHQLTELAPLLAAHLKIDIG